MSREFDSGTMNSAIHQLRELLQAQEVENPFLDSDTYLRRWIEDKNFNLEHARSAILKNLKWRVETSIDLILTENFDDVWKPFAYKIDGLDLNGRPIIIVNSDIFQDIPEKEMKARLKTAMKNKERSKRYVYFLAETLFQTIHKNSVEHPGVKDSLVIIDMKGVEIINYLKQIRSVIPIIMELQEICELHYPGMVHQVCIINAPKKSMTVISKIIKPIVSSEAMEKVVIFGKKQEKWQKGLLERISPDQLSSEYGGNRIDAGISARSIN